EGRTPTLPSYLLTWAGRGYGTPTVLMDRDELAALDEEALIELILRLYEWMTELEARVGRPPKGPGSSSVPPSAGYKPNRAERRRETRGPKRGHPGLSRQCAAPDVMARCRPTACRGCGAALAANGQRRFRRSQVVELPGLRPVVMQAWVCPARGAARGARMVGDAPAGLTANRRSEARVEALAGYPHYGHHLSYERLGAVRDSVFGLRISDRATAALGWRTPRAAPEVAATREAPRASPASSSDETGVRVDARSLWRWVFQTPTASYDMIAPSRGATVVAHFLGEARPGVWGSDAFPTQLAAPAGQHRLCSSYQI